MPLRLSDGRRDALFGRPSRIVSPPTMTSAVNASRPIWMLPVTLLIQPISVGLTKPPRMPSELITAMPVAAASRLR
jgi:hypothetical protein